MKQSMPFNPIELAHYLIKIKAIIFSPDFPFTYSSGLKSPIYCDLRQLISYPQQRNQVIIAFLSVIQSMKLDVDAIVGTATAGIPYAAFLAERMHLPMAYVRGSAKKHGRGKQIEGCLKSGQRVLLIEDLISTAGSIIEAADALLAEGIEIAHGMAIFNYQLAIAESRCKKLSWPLFNLLDLDILLSEAHAMGNIDSSGLKMIQAWRKDPDSWSSHIGEI